MKHRGLTPSSSVSQLPHNPSSPPQTQLMQIPCTSVVPGNQQRVAPVYGLTECYLVTVCIDQPVASDAITPPPEPELPPTDGGAPTAPARGPTGAGAARARARDADEMPEMGAGEEEAMGPRVPPGYPLPAEDKEEDDSGYYGASSLVIFRVIVRQNLGSDTYPTMTPSKHHSSIYAIHAEPSDVESVAVEDMPGLGA